MTTLDIANILNKWQDVEIGDMLRVMFKSAVSGEADAGVRLAAGLKILADQREIALARLTEFALAQAGKSKP